MKISARNVDGKTGATTAHGRIDVGVTMVTATITNEAADALALEDGQSAYTVITASDVMIGID